MNLVEYEHESVLLKEALGLLVTDRDGLYVDATLGLGGHSEAILKILSPRGKLLGLDMDRQSLDQASRRLQDRPGQFKAVCANFKDAGDILKKENFLPLSGALFDLGVSSLHFDKPQRGFSFRHEGPLDMRLSTDNPLTAQTIVNRWPEEQIALLLEELGEEPQARRIARAIAQRRASKPFETTTDLASCIEKIIPRAKTHPATRTFMALRMAVNAELENLDRGLQSILPCLRPGGRLCVISFHSLEDRIVKNFFAAASEQGKCRLLAATGKIRPSQEEVERNPRARSATLRAVEKLP